MEKGNIRLKKQRTTTKTRYRKWKNRTKGRKELIPEIQTKETDMTVIFPPSTTADWTRSRFLNQEANPLADQQPRRILVHKNLPQQE